MVKRTLIVLALIALFSIAVLYAALAAHAELPCAEAAVCAETGAPGGIPDWTGEVVTAEAAEAPKR